MSAYTADYLEAIEHLPDGAMLRLEDITWEDYEQLLEELTEWPGMRVSYDRGRVEIMSPLPEHEEYKDFIYSLVRITAEEMNLNLETRGSTTFKRKGELKGAEPDASFYVLNASSIVGRRGIDLDVDPPPDIVVEVDITNESLSKFPIYAAFLVPEIWRYDGKQARIYHLVNQTYVEGDTSLSFPVLTTPAMTEFLEQSKTQGQTASLAAFRQWLRAARAARPVND
jgi:Uma2 family endonuclease